MWAILTSLHINSAREWAPERMFVVFCWYFPKFINILSCLLLLQLGPKHHLHWVTHLTVSPSFACSSGYAIQNTDVSQLEKPSLVLLWFLAEIRQKELIFVWRCIPPVLLLELDSVIGIQLSDLQERGHLWKTLVRFWKPLTVVSSGFSRAWRKNNYVIFLMSAPDTKDLNACVCVCVCLCVWNPTV